MDATGKPFLKACQLGGGDAAVSLQFVSLVDFGSAEEAAAELDGLEEPRGLLDGLLQEYFVDDFALQTEDFVENCVLAIASDRVLVH